MTRDLVSLANGQRMHISCIGRGTPTVVFEQGLGAHILTWDKVVLPISKQTRTCVYDRSGQGFSAPSKEPMTASNITRDLHALLSAAKIRGPIILVGHSIGGLYATLYADRYLPELAGLVLVDPSFAGQDAAMSDPAAKQRSATAFEAQQKLMATCAALAKEGHLTEGNPACPWRFVPNRTPVEKAYVEYAAQHPFKYEGDAAEMRSVYSATPGKNEDADEERAAKRSFGALPLTVLTAGKQRPMEPGETEEGRKIQDAFWKQGHDALAARSTNGKSILVPDAGHFIQIDQPAAVIDAIAEVLGKARATEQH